MIQCFTKQYLKINSSKLDLLLNLDSDNYDYFCKIRFAFVPMIANLDLDLKCAIKLN